MKRISYLLLALICVVLLLWQLPWCYAFLSGSPSTNSFTLYSPLADDFLTLEHSAGQGTIRYDQSGRRYSEHEQDSLLPFMYFRQLLSAERLPDTIMGHPVDVHTIQMSNFSWRMTAYEASKPAIGLYPLLESLPRRVDLEMPSDVMRFTDSGVEFVVMETNSVDVRKSQLFTDMLRSKGFHFPAYRASGNPTPRKDYDEGYLVLDADRRLFHLKMTAGRPYVRAIALPDGASRAADAAGGASASAAGASVGAGGTTSEASGALAVAGGTMSEASGTLAVAGGTTSEASGALAVAGGTTLADAASADAAGGTSEAAGSPRGASMDGSAGGPLAPIEIAEVFETEFRSHRILGLLSDTEARLYVVLSDYSVHLCEGVRYRPTADRITIFGNMLDWTVRVTGPADSGETVETCYAISASDFHLIRQMERVVGSRGIFGLHFTSSSDIWVYPRF